jgi:hypothetical protein
VKEKSRELALVLEAQALTVLARAVLTLVHRGLWAAPDILAHAAIDLVFRGFALAHRIPFQNDTPGTSCSG